MSRWHVPAAAVLTVLFLVCAVSDTGAQELADLTTGDFNRDGLWDVVVTRFEQDRIDVYSAAGPDTFGAPVGYPVEGPVALAVLDIEGDSDSDVAVACASPHAVRIFCNSGSGQFAQGQVVYLDYQPLTVVPSQSNAARCDLFVFDLDFQLRHVLMNDGYGLFVPVEPPVGPDPGAEPGIDYWVTCGNEPPPPNPNPDGVQECIEAAHARADRCTWAACVLRESGEIGFLRYAGAMMTCHFIHDLEATFCVKELIE
ncbi:MAG: VCBS repeat-containing protein [Planctomycetota bacterium]